jgi:hypothetical protein
MSSRAADGRLSVGTIRRIAVVIKVIAIVGSALFGALAVVVATAPGAVERAARGYVSYRLQAEVAAVRAGSPAIAALIPDPDLAAMYAVHLRALQQQASAVAEALLDKWLASLCRDACEDEAKTRALLHAAFSALPENTKAALGNLQSIGQGRFVSIVDKLRHELTLISVTNLAIFLFLLLVASIAREQRLVILPAAMLAASTLVTLAFYVFGTNWWWAVLTDGYWGFGYLVLDAIVFALFVDIIVFRGIITNAILSVIGALVSLIPV